MVGLRRELGSSDAKRHVSLAETLRRRIAAGDFPVGAGLPTERAIAQNEQVSRGTVREALRLLERDGMIVRRQGSGTTVISRRPQSFVQPLESLDALLSYPKCTHIRLLGAKKITSDAPLETACGLPSARRWLRLDLCRFVQATGAPVSHTYAYCPPQLKTGPEDIGALEAPVFRMVERQLGLHAGRAALRIEAIATPDELTGILEVPMGTPAIRIVRSYHDLDERIYQISVTTHPAGRYAFEASIPV
jgi:DNA-binding GntR family transcriptional regulator